MYTYLHVYFVHIYEYIKFSPRELSHSILCIRPCVTLSCSRNLKLKTSKSTPAHDADQRRLHYHTSIVRAEKSYWKKSWNPGRRIRLLKTIAYWPRLSCCWYKLGKWFSSEVCVQIKQKSVYRIKTLLSHSTCFLFVSWLLLLLETVI